MAHLIPQNYYLENRPISERTVFEQIQQQFSDEWYVFHSFNYLNLDANNYRQDREIDFLFYHPQHGILALEVKGGTISYHNGNWYQEDWIIDPVGQARRNKYAIQSLLEQQLHIPHPFPIKMAHAVCFPSCPPGKIWPLEARGIVITQEALGLLESMVIQILQYVREPDLQTPPPSQEQILSILNPVFEYGGRLCDRKAAEDKQIFYMTEQQCQIMGALAQFRKLQICGAAGTGKTLLAIQKAKLLAMEGKRVLLLCFNELLASRICEQCLSCPRITTGAVYQFCCQMMQIPKEEFQRHKKEPTLYTQVLPSLLRKYLESHSRQWDALIIDEAQDFPQELWDPLSLLVKPEGYFYLFYDPDQNIFHQSLALPDFGLAPILLERNCRNTRRIWEHFRNCQHSLPSKIHESAPVGAEVIERTGTDLNKILAEELTRLTKTEGAHPHNITVLGAHSLSNPAMQGTNPAPFRLEENKTNNSPNSIAYYTYMKFKGCESPVIILLDVNPDDPRWDDSGLYTSMSRAVHQLVILRRAPSDSPKN